MSFVDFGLKYLKGSCELGDSQHPPMGPVNSLLPGEQRSSEKPPSESLDK